MFRKRKDINNITNIETVAVQTEDVHLFECGNVAKRLGELEKSIQKMRSELEKLYHKEPNGV